MSYVGVHGFRLTSRSQLRLHARAATGRSCSLRTTARVLPYTCAPKRSRAAANMAPPEGGVARERLSLRFRVGALVTDNPFHDQPRIVVVRDVRALGAGLKAQPPLTEMVRVPAIGQIIRA
jgi:hypothetical protein